MILPLCLLQLKISFNESSLASTYEYPSESSTWDSGDEDEDEKEDEKVADDQPSMVGRIHIPRPSFTTSPTHTTNSNGETTWNMTERRKSGVKFEITSGIRISVKLVSISTDIDQTAMKLTGDIHDPQRMIHSNDFGSPLKHPLAQKLYLSNTWYTTMNLEIIQRIFDVIVYIHGPRRINHFMWWPSKLCSEATRRSKCILVQTVWSTTSSLEIKWQLHLKCHCRCSWSPEDASSSVVAGDPLNFAVRQPRKEIPLVILETQNSCRIITAFSEHTPAPQRMNIFNFEHPKLAPLWINTNHAIKCVYVAVM